MEGEESRSQPTGVGCVAWLFTVVYVGGFFVLLPKVYTILIALLPLLPRLQLEFLLNPLTLRLIYTLTLASYLCAGFFVYYRLEEWGVLPDERSGLLRYLAKVSRRSIPLWLWFGLVSHVLWGTAQVTGDGMMPTIHSGDRVVWTPVAYVVTPPERGDIILVRAAAGERFTRRIVGLPGETIGIADGRLVINNELLNESYLGNDIAPLSVQPRPLGPDEYAVLLDRRAMRKGIGMVIKRKDILGRYFLRYSPLPRFGLLPNARYIVQTPERGLQGVQAQPLVTVGWSDGWGLPIIMGIVVLSTVLGSCFVYGTKPTLVFIGKNWPVLVSVGIAVVSAILAMSLPLAPSLSITGRILFGIWILSSVMVIPLYRYMRRSRNETKARELIELARFYVSREELHSAISALQIAISTTTSDHTRSTALKLLSELQVSADLRELRERRASSELWAQHRTRHVEQLKCKEGRKPTSSLNDGCEHCSRLQDKHKYR